MSLKTRPVWQFGPYRLDAAERLLQREGVEVRLPPKAFDLLIVLAGSGGRLMQKEDLLKEVWPDSFVEESSLAQHISMLRRILQEGEGGALYIETVPKQGYRFVSPVTLISQAEPAGEGLRGDSSSAGGFRISRWQLAIAGSLLLLAIAAAVWPRLQAKLSSRSPSAQAAPSKVMLAVLPFENLTGDAAQDFFSDGFTEEMITQLGHLDPVHMGVIARTSAMHYRDTKLGVDAIARELGVQYIVEGSVRRSGDRIRISAQLIQVRDQTHLWAQNYDREGRDVLEIQGQVASAIAEQIELKLTPEATARFTRSASVNLQAYDAYLQGRYFWNRRDRQGLVKAVRYLEEAVALDSTQPKFYAGLADALAIMGSLPDSPVPRPQAMERARAAALKAISLDELSAEPHASLGFVEMHYDWNWVAAEREFRRAIELNPSYATAHHWYAYYLMAMERQDESLAEIRRAEQLDPLSLIIQRDVADMLYFARRYDEAIAQCRKVLERDPQFELASFSLYQIYAVRRMAPEMDEAFRAMQADLHGLPLTATAPGDAMVGRKEKARRELVEMQRQESQGKNLAHAMAIAYAALGDRDQAFHWLDIAIQAREGSLILLKTDPMLDPLRADPRFSTLIKKMSLSLPPGKA
ncbi:MAG TPA: winged helix-turn-helix domain-containing protein [Terriglobales bacterium]|nr:winged helix-turn-helix domain-containing protein [Terriglobales bacterium]